MADVKPTPSPANPGRSFLGVLMKCCRVYVRAYLAASGSEYSGRCPRCGSYVRVPVVAKGGSSDRFFEAS